MGKERDPRKVKTGAVFTPRNVAAYLVDRTLEPLRARAAQVRLLEPACGHGVFLTESVRWMSQHGPHDMPAVSVVERLTAFDIARAHVETAREAVRHALAGRARDGAADERVPDSVWTENFVTGDVLDDRAGAPASRLDPGTFDAVIGNPPYLNARRLARFYDAGFRQHLRKRYRCARGAFDLYVPFVERAFELLRPGGRCGLVLPNKIAAADYARACRRLITEEGTLEEIVDLSSIAVFPGHGVYPYLVIWKRDRSGSATHVRVVRPPDLAMLGQPGRLANVTEAVPATQFGEARFSVERPLDVESRRQTRPLGTVAEIRCGTAGFRARELHDALRESAHLPETTPVYPFLVSANVGAFQLIDRPVRFLRTRFERPVVPVETPCLSNRQRTTFAHPKIVVKGLSRRLEGAWDPGGHALGVQVFALLANPMPPWLLGLLNSKLWSYLYRTRFGAKQLSGGYLAVHRTHLDQMPALGDEPGSVREDRRRLDAVSDATHLLTAQPTLIEPRERLDQAVYELFRLRDAEIERVEGAPYLGGSSASPTVPPSNFH